MRPPTLGNEEYGTVLDPKEKGPWVDEENSIRTGCRSVVI